MAGAWFPITACEETIVDANAGAGAVMMVAASRGFVEDASFIESSVLECAGNLDEDASAPDVS